MIKQIYIIPISFSTLPKLFTRKPVDLGGRLVSILGGQGCGNAFRSADLPREEKIVRRRDIVDGVQYKGEGSSLAIIHLFFCSNLVDHNAISVSSRLNVK
jgi:hypothetical protein